MGERWQDVMILWVAVALIMRGCLLYALIPGRVKTGVSVLTQLLAELSIDMRGFTNTRVLR